MVSDYVTHIEYTPHSSVSIGVTGNIVVCMIRTLSQYITERREALGLNQTELAKRAGVERTLINRLESGTTKLPAADKRRAIAKGLGVSHIDILVAAGELAQDEVVQAGVQGVVEPGPKANLQAEIDRFEWTQEQADDLVDLIEWRMRRRGKNVD